MAYVARVEGGASAPTCTRHRTARAGWRCAACNARLCAACAATKGLAGTSITVCASCGDRVHPITVHRSVMMPFWVRLLDAPRFPFVRSVLLSLLGLAALMSVIGWLLGRIPPMMAMSMWWGRGLLSMTRIGAFWAYFFFIVRATATGTTHIGVPEFRDRSDLFGPAWRGLVGTALVWLPPLLYAASAHGLSLGTLLSPASLVENLAEAMVARDPVFWLFVLFGAAYAPVALLAASTEIGIVGMLNPILMVSFVRRLGRDYWTATLALGVLGFVSGLADNLLLPHVRRLPIPIVGAWLATAAGPYLPFVMARVLGLLLYVHGDEIGWGDAHEYEEPVLRGAEPQGKPPGPRPAAAAPGAPARPAAREPIALAEAPPEPPPRPRASAPDPIDAPLTIMPEPAPDMVAPAAPSIVAAHAVSMPPSDARQIVSLPPLAGAGLELVASRAVEPLDAPPAITLPPSDAPDLAQVIAAAQAAPRAPAPPLPAPAPPTHVPPPLAAVAPAPPAPVTIAAGAPPAARSMPTAYGFAAALPIADPAPPAAPAPAEPPPAHATSLGWEVALPRTAGGLEADIVAALAADDVHRAVELYASAPDPSRLGVDVSQHYAAGCAAARVGNLPLAVAALKLACMTTDPVAGRALVALAQVYDGGFGDRQLAVKLYREAMTRFPGGKVAAYAAGKLKALAG